MYHMAFHALLHLYLMLTTSARATGSNRRAGSLIEKYALGSASPVY